MQSVPRWIAWMVLLGIVSAVSPARAADPALEERVRALEEALREAQGEIRSLRRELEERERTGGTAPVAATPPAPPEPPAATAGTSAPPADAEPTEAERALASVAEKFSRFTPFGDLRVRYEGFYNRPGARGTEVHERDRGRLRARIGVTYQHNDEIGATLRIATGDPDDPTSTNTSFDGAFSRQSVNLDWAYLTFAPGESFGMRPGLLTVTGGKFPVPFFRTGELIFDDDLSLEGVAETIAVLDEPFGPLDALDFHAAQVSFAEVSNGADGWMFGAQVHPRTHIGNVVVEGGVGHYYWHKPDLIAQELNSNDALVNTNLVTTRTTAAGTEITGYQSGFNHTDLSLAFTHPDAIWHKPLSFFGDVVYNWEAKNDEDQTALRAGVQLGKTKRRRDWMLQAYYARVARESVISAFSYSDFGTGGTNLQGPVLEVGYQLLDPLTLSARSIFTNFIDKPAGITNPTQVRLQVDAKLKF